MYLIINIYILADIANLTFLSKNSVFTWKYYIMSWNTRSTPETLSGAFKLSAPVSFSGEKKSTFSSPESTPEYSGVGVLHNTAMMCMHTCLIYILFSAILSLYAAIFIPCKVLLHSKPKGRLKKNLMCINVNITSLYHKAESATFGLIFFLIHGDN